MRKIFKLLSIFLFSILFMTTPAFGNTNTQNVTKVNADHQINYDIFMDNETGTYSAKVLSFLTIYPNDTINFINATVHVTIFRSNNTGNYSELKPLYFDNKSEINRNGVKLLVDGFIAKNISYCYNQNIGESITIPHSTYKICLDGDSNRTILNDHPTKVVISLPYDDYNYSEFVYSTIPAQDVYSEVKRVTVVLNGIEEYTKYQRPFLLFFVTKEDKSKKALDEITMNTEDLWRKGIYCAIVIGVLSPFVSLFVIWTLKRIKKYIA